MDRIVSGMMRPTQGEDKDLSGFFVMVTGQIDHGDFGGVENLYCKYAFTNGPDWKGIENGISQIARSGEGGTSIVWNFPIDITFKTTNVFGWPRLVVSVYGVDSLGRDVIRGYGSCHIPTVPGHHTCKIRTFKPLSSSKVQQAVSWLTGVYPEFFDAKFVAQGEGREVTRVESSGVVVAKFNVTTRGMAVHGFSDGTKRPKASGSAISSSVDP